MPTGGSAVVLITGKGRIELRKSCRTPQLERDTSTRILQYEPISASSLRAEFGPWVVVTSSQIPAFTASGSMLVVLPELPTATPTAMRLRSRQSCAWAARAAPAMQTAVTMTPRVAHKRMPAASSDRMALQADQSREGVMKKP
jgi:hypothetical protein